MPENSVLGKRPSLFERMDFKKPLVAGYQDKHPEKTNPLENKFTKSLEPQKSPNKQIDFSSLTRSRYQGTNNFNITNNNTSQIGSNLSNLSLTNKDFCKSLTENKIKTWSNLTTGNLHNLEQQNSEGLITKWIGGMERREMSGGGVENVLNVGLNVRTNINNGAGQTSSPEEKLQQEQTFPQYKFNTSNNIDKHNVNKAAEEVSESLIESRRTENECKKEALVTLMSMLSGSISQQLLDKNSDLRKAIDSMLHDVTLFDPEFVLKLSLYTRRQLNLRLAANFLLAYAATNNNTKVFVKKYFNASVRLPSDWMQVASIALGLNTDLKIGNIPNALRVALEKKFSEFDEYQLAKYNTKPKLNDEIDDIRGQAFSLKRLVRTLHIGRPADMVCKILGKKYPMNSEEFRQRRLEGLFDPEKAGKRMKLATPETWETMLSAKGNKPEVWEELIDKKKLPYMAAVRNIRNILLAGVSSACVKKVADFIQNEKMVQRGGMFPFQYFTAFAIIEELSKRLEIMNKGGKKPPSKKDEEKEKEKWQKAKEAETLAKLKKVNKNDLRVLERSLDRAVNISARTNVPPLQGNTLIFCCYGNDGMDRLTAAKGLTKTGSNARDVCLLYSLMTASRCEQVDLVMFAGITQKVTSLSPDLLDNMKHVSDKLGSLLSTNSRAEPVKDILKDCLKEKKCYDNIIIFHHNNNFNFDTDSEFLHMLAIYRELLNPGMLFTSVGVAQTGFRMADTNNRPEKYSSPQNVFLYGFSDTILKFVIQNGNSRQLDAIDSIDKTFDLDCGRQGVFMARTDLIKEIQFPKWRCVKVFVSSTFKDMQGERAMLHNFVLPSLQQRCNSLFVKVGLIDLRWGIIDDHQQQNQVVECLKQVQQADFFIGLIGERYGWIPTKQQKSGTKELFCGKLLEEVLHEEISMTHLEIKIGALEKMDIDESSSFFYIRSNEMISSIPDNIRTDYVDEDPYSKEKLEELKNTLIHSGLEVFVDYPADFNKHPVSGDHYAGGLQELGERIIENIWNGIENKYGVETITSSSNLEAMLLNQLSECESVSRNFIPRPTYINKIKVTADKMFESGREKGGIIQLAAPSGSGCTAILQYLANSYRNSSKDVKVVSFFSQDGQKIEIREFLQYLFFSLGRQNKTVSGNEELKSDLYRAIQSNKTNLLIITNRSDLLSELSWLESDIPKGVVVISRESEKSRVFFKRIKECQFIKIGPLDMKQRRQLLGQELKRLGKQMSQGPWDNQILETITQREGGSPRFLKMLVNLLSREATHQTLTKDMKEFGSTVKEIVSKQLSRAEDSHGRQAVVQFLSILRAARYGLQLSELSVLMSYLMFSNDQETKKTMEINQFFKISDTRYSTLEMVSLITKLEGLVHVADGIYFITQGYGEEIIQETYFRTKTFDETRRVLNSIFTVLKETYDSFSNCEPRILKSLVYLLGCMEDAKRLEELVCTIKYCRAACETGLLGFLLDTLAGQFLNTRYQKNKFLLKPEVQAWSAFLREYGSDICRQPALLNQLIVNLPGDNILVKTYLETLADFSDTGKLVQWVNRPETGDQGTMITKKDDKYPTAMIIQKDILFVGFNDGLISVFNTETFREGISFIGQNSEITGLAVAGSSTLLSISADGKLSSWNLQTKIRLKCIQAHYSKGTAVCASNHNIVSVGWDGFIHTWNNGLLNLSSISRDQVPINTALLHPSKNYVIIGSWDKTVRIFDLDSKHQKAIIHSTQSIQMLALSANADLLAFGCLRGDVNVYDSKRSANLSSANFGSRITCLDFDEENEMLDVGLENGIVKKLDYLSGKRLADPVNPSNVAVSQKLSDMYDPDCCQKPYGTQFVSYILTLSGDHVDDCDVGISGQLVFVGFDSGTVHVYNQLEGRQDVNGWQAYKEPVSMIQHFSCSLARLDWSLTGYQVQELILISYSTKLTVLRVAYNGKIQHLADMDLDDEIIIYTSVLAGHGHRLVLVATHNSIWFFNLENVENIDVDSKLILPEAIHPIQKLNKEIDHLVSVTEIPDNQMYLLLADNGELYQFDALRESVKKIPRVFDTQDTRVIRMIPKNISHNSAIFIVYENGNIVRGETRDTTSTQLCWKLDWKTFKINGNGIKYAHADYESDLIALVQSCGTICTWSIKGEMLNVYRRNNCNAWLYGDQLFIGGAEYVQLFNPKMAGVVDNYLGHTSTATTLLNTGKVGPGRLSGAKDGTIKVVNNNLVPRGPELLEPGVDMFSYLNKSMEKEYLMVLTGSGKILQYNVSENNLNFDVKIECLPVEDDYIGCFLCKGEETKIVIISTTKIYILDQFTYKLQQTINLKSEENVLKIISWSQDNENTAILKVKAVTHSKDLEFLIDLKECLYYKIFNNQYKEMDGIEALFSKDGQPNEMDNNNPRNIENGKNATQKSYDHCLTKDSLYIEYGDTKKLTISDGRKNKVGEFSGQGFEFVCVEALQDCLVALDNRGNLFQLKIV